MSAENDGLPWQRNITKGQIGGDSLSEAVDVLFTHFAGRGKVQLAAGCQEQCRCQCDPSDQCR